MPTPTTISDPKPGDVFALVRHRNGESAVERVKIERTTKTQAHDTKGRAWWRKDGSRVGASSKAFEWSSQRWDRLVPWTHEHEAMLAEQRINRTLAEALEALGKLQRTVGPDAPRARAALARALPHIQAAVAALAEPDQG